MGRDDFFSKLQLRWGSVPEGSKHMKIWLLESSSLGQENILYGKKFCRKTAPILYVPKCSMSAGLARVVVRIILWPEDGIQCQQVHAIFR